MVTRSEAHMESWEQWAGGAVALLALWFFWPGSRKGVKEAPTGTRDDWMGLLKPIGAVVIVVVLMLMLVSQ